MDYKLLLVIVLTFLSVRETAGYKILGLFPHFCRSQVVMFKSLMKGLAERGHEVHVLSHYPRKTPIINYTDLSVLGSVPLINNKVPFHLPEFHKFDIFNVMTTIALHSRIDIHENVMKSDTVQKLMESDERYDLIITESFTLDMMIGFVNKFNVPFILMSSCALTPWTSSLVANPQNPAFVPHFLSQLAPKMSFMERVINTGGLILNLAAWHWFYVPANQRILRKYFGDDTPPLLDTLKNVSLIFTNSHPTIHGARPAASNVIDVGGIHIEPANNLPEDIEKFIQESPHGVIYFCMGSLLRAATLPEWKKSAFIHTFSRLKERVLWKFEDENLDVPDNVMIKDWMPQRDILAHPKVKLFISHGGLMGTLEAISEGKPMLSIPFYGDQRVNALALKAQGVVRILEYGEINNETIYDAVQEMLEQKYLERAKEVSRLFHDRPMKPMDTAVYWVEYVIRNKGAKHLRSVAVDLPFYEYLLLDVILFYLVSVISCLYLIYYVSRWFVVDVNQLIGRRS